MRPRSRDRRAGGIQPAGPRGRELLLGVHAAREALRAGRRTLHRLCLRSGERAERAALRRAAEEAGVPVEDLSASDFDARVPPGVPHQGVALEAGPLPEVMLGELVPAADTATCWLLALDGVEDPQNLGAILRVADAAGVRGVLLPERRAAPLSPAVARASAGALEHVPVARVTNLSRSLERLKQEGFWVHGADPEAEAELFAQPDRLFEGRLVLVVGAEGRGLRPGVRAALDVSYRIPMRGAVASLNVAAATAVVLFDWARRERERASCLASGEPAGRADRSAGTGDPPAGRRRPGK